ncbi:MAG: NUDIX hydrolase [Chroococcidiopsidaceae cyanobacterium CP_BM_ER_R8_30]|nr:NUDIX hydrolase [Chroococcidiopsidaceae cyanobacterium CP_BM_ER_R8_30]
MSNQTTSRVAIAILYCQGQFLLQLRDNISSISYPGHWGLFGGHVEPGETPDDAIQRELMEEICYVPPYLSEFRRYIDSDRVRHVYHAPLTVDVNQLVLQEGWDLSLLTPEQIRQGSAYSLRAARLCPLAPPPQQILLDFLEQS